MGNMTLWIAGRNTAYINLVHNGQVDCFHAAWELLGIYDDKDKAIARCSTPHDFVGPVALNENLPDETTEWPESFYPVQNDSGDGANG